MASAPSEALHEEGGTKPGRTAPTIASLPYEVSAFPQGGDSASMPASRTRTRSRHAHPPDFPAVHRGLHGPAGVDVAGPTHGREGVRLPGCRRRGRHGRRRHRRRGNRAKGTGGRRMGDCRDHGPAHEVLAHGRHRRPGPVPHPRSPQGQLPGVGARLRARRLAQDDRRHGNPPRPQGGGCARREGRRALLPRRVLVLADQGARQGRVPRHRRERQRHPARRSPRSTSTSAC